MFSKTNHKSAQAKTLSERSAALTANSSAYVEAEEAPPPLKAAAPAPEPVVRKPQAKSSTIASGIIIEGNVIGTGDFVLEGTVRGDVKVAHLIVGEEGSIEGKVEAETVDVRGRVVGTIGGRQVRLQSTAYVDGDITHDELAIEAGAFFQGRCVMARQAQPVPASQSIINGAAPLAVQPFPATQLTDDGLTTIGHAPVAQPAQAQAPVQPSVQAVPRPVAAPAPSSYDFSNLNDLK